MAPTSSGRAWRRVPRFEPLYGYARALQLEGTYPEDVGSWGVTGMRVLKAYGALEVKTYLRQDRKNWPPDFPADADARAKKHRVQCYQRIRSVAECLCALSAGVPVMAVFAITASFVDYVPPDPIDVRDDGTPEDQLHAVLITGFEGGGSTLHFVNCWGKNWGDGGFGSMTRAFFEQRLVEAWCTPPAARGLQPPKGSGTQLLTWGVPDLFAGLHPQADVLHGIEIYDSELDDYLAWAFVVRRGLFLDIEELFVRPEWRRAGKGRVLSNAISALSSVLAAPVRLWIPHADAFPEGKGARERICALLGAELRATEHRWASFVADIQGASGEVAVDEGFWSCRPGGSKYPEGLKRG